MKLKMLSIHLNISAAMNSLPKALEEHIISEKFHYYSNSPKIRMRMKAVLETGRKHGQRKGKSYIDDIDLQNNMKSVESSSTDLN